jgi:hypothetical protein
MLDLFGHASVLMISAHRGKKQTSRRWADTSGFDNGHQNANWKLLVP